MQPFRLAAAWKTPSTEFLLGRLQYIYDDFGGKPCVAAGGGIYRVSLTSQTLRGALSWKF
jgi:hypothetical protein